ncbi:MAG: ABC transporter ATP-binding protein [Deltaproteobacteria bacterium]|nr:ABC transporter ATP-binding protein [Deltaproteobacteria bacterium]MBW1873123.1 ABC transporter ATP-binding protein [Deltaproteobacteria bacterium]
MIHFEKVSRVYGKAEIRTEALREVSLEVQAASFVTVVGTSGSGKTTLLNIIGGLDTDYTGKVEVASKTLKEMSDKELSQFRNKTVGFVFQHFNLLEHLNALQNVSLPAFFSGEDDKTAIERAEQVLVRVGLKDKLQSRPGQLSGGQKQRVAIARALFSRPRLILADEPTGNLDTRTGEQTIALFESLNSDDGLTVIAVTHEEFLFKNATRTIHMEDGRLVSGGPE